jgi:hypothetical protein
MHPDILQAIMNEHVRDLRADLESTRRSLKRRAR